MARAMKMMTVSTHALVGLLLLICLWSSTTWAAYDDNKAVYLVNEETQGVSIDDIRSSASHWVLHFFDAGKEPSRVSQVYSSLATLLEGFVAVAAIDVSTKAGSGIASQFKVNTATTLLIGDDKKEPISTYNDDTTDPDLSFLVNNIVNAAVKTIEKRAASGGHSTFQPPRQDARSTNHQHSTSAVISDVTNANFDEKVLQDPSVIAVAFTAPWCGHCKRLEPEWHEAASKLQGAGAKLVWIDATVEQELAAKFDVRGYPTIKVFRGGAPKTPETDAYDYAGERTAPSIVQSLLAEVDRSGVVDMDIPELTSKDVLDESCAGQNHICVLAALPHILDSGSDGRNKYRDLVAAVSKSFRGSAFSFLWFEGTSQPHLEQALELTFGFPALVALSLDRKAYAVLHGSFSEKSLTAFLHNIMTGRQGTVPLNGGIPKVLAVSPWDGQDGAPIEEDMSLDEIMGWDDEDTEAGGEL